MNEFAEPARAAIAADNEDKVKQVIVIRKDLNMRKGKMIAQGAHASMAFLSEYITKGWLFSNFTKSEQEWLAGLFTKVVVSVDSEVQLLKLHIQAQEAGLRSHLIRDAGLTEFSEPTNTCLAIGPDKASRIDPLCGHLPLL